MNLCSSKYLHWGTALFIFFLNSDVVDKYKYIFFRDPALLPLSKYPEIEACIILKNI